MLLPWFVLPLPPPSEIMGKRSSLVLMGLMHCSCHCPQSLDGYPRAKMENFVQDETLILILRRKLAASVACLLLCHP